MTEFEIAKLDLGPRDVLVVRLRGRITDAIANAVRGQFRTAFPDRRIIIIDDAIGLSVLHEVTGE